MAGSILYDDSPEPFTGRPVPYHQQNAVRGWARHYANFLYLEFIRSRSDDREERRRAEHEIRICQRKMDHWQRHGNWDAVEAGRAREQEDSRWRGTRR